MPGPLDIDVQAQVACSLRLLLEYLLTHAHLRELFSIQELLSRHAAGAAWQLSQQALPPVPKAYQEMPVALRQQLAELERQQALRRAPQAQTTGTPAPYRQEG